MGTWVYLQGCTGYKLRKHIASSLQSRSQAVKSALKRYNDAARAFKPPRPSLSWEEVVDYAFLSDFDLLRDTRQDIRQKPWAQPANRSLMNQWFKLQRAREEIERLNIEIRRVITHMQDEEQFLLSLEDELQATKPTLAFHIARYRHDQTRFYELHRQRFAALPTLDGFTGSVSPGISVDPSLRSRDPPKAHPALARHMDVDTQGGSDSSEAESDEEVEGLAEEDVLEARLKVLELSSS